MGRHQADAEEGGVVGSGDDEAQFAHGLRGQHPCAAVAVLRVHLLAGNLEVELDAVIEVERPLQVDLNQRAEMGLLGLVQLFPAEASGVDAVVELVVGGSENLRGHLPSGSRRCSSAKTSAAAGSSVTGSVIPADAFAGLFGPPRQSGSLTRSAGRSARAGTGA